MLLFKLFFYSKAYDRMSRGSNHDSIQVMLLLKPCSSTCEHHQCTVYSIHWHTCSQLVHVITFKSGFCAMTELWKISFYSSHDTSIQVMPFYVTLQYIVLVVVDKSSSV
eukprot:scpid44624/ scgid23134/ 